MNTTDFFSFFFQARALNQVPIYFCLSHVLWYYLLRHVHKGLVFHDLSFSKLSDLWPWCQYTFLWTDFTFKYKPIPNYTLEDMTVYTWRTYRLSYDCRLIQRKFLDWVPSALVFAVWIASLFLSLLHSINIYLIVFNMFEFESVNFK